MTVVIQRRPPTQAPVYLCATNTALPRWGKLEAFSALLTFATAKDAEDFMEKCSTIEFDEHCAVEPIGFGEDAAAASVE